MFIVLWTPRTPWASIHKTILEHIFHTPCRIQNSYAIPIEELIEKARGGNMRVVVDIEDTLLMHTFLCNGIEPYYFETTHVSQQRGADFHNISQSKWVRIEQLNKITAERRPIVYRIEQESADHQPALVLWNGIPRPHRGEEDLLERLIGPMQIIEYMNTTSWVEMIQVIHDKHPNYTVIPAKSSWEMIRFLLDETNLLLFTPFNVDAEPEQTVFTPLADISISINILWKSRENRIGGRVH